MVLGRCFPLSEAHAGAAEAALAPKGRVVQHHRLGVAPHEATLGAAAPLGGRRRCDRDALQHRQRWCRHHNVRRRKHLASGSADVQQARPVAGSVGMVAAGSGVRLGSHRHDGAVEPCVEARLTVLRAQGIHEQRGGAPGAAVSYPRVLRCVLHFDLCGKHRARPRVLGQVAFQLASHAPLRNHMQSLSLSLIVASALGQRSGRSEGPRFSLRPLPGIAVSHSA